MQQQNSTTSNVHIKLITDARKLLEKVRSQQDISADSSFDSSFLFEQMQDSKEFEVKKDNNDDKPNLTTITIVNDNSNPEAEFESQLPIGICSSTSASTIGTNHDNTSPVQTQTQIFSKNCHSNERPPKGPTDEEPDQDQGPIIYINTKRNTNKIPIEDDDVESVLHEENVKLKKENYQLHEEMNDFEYKLYCLEHSLGIIEDVEQTSQTGESKHNDYSNSNSVYNSNENMNPSSVGGGTKIVMNSNRGVNFKAKNQRPDPLDIKESTPMNTVSGTENDDSIRLSPVTAMVADAMIAGTGVKGIHLSNNIQSRSSSRSGREAPPPTPCSNDQLAELQLLRKNNGKMVIAIKALAQATIAQTRKHYMYKKRHYMTKKMVVEESNKAGQLKVEKDQLQAEFYETRSSYLKEMDIREELSTEVQDLAKKNNSMRRQRIRHEEMRRKILERVECRDDSASVLSRLSDSSCFPILQTITENIPSQVENMEQQQQQSRNDKNVEKLIAKLLSQLKKRDTKIEKLEKKLKISMQYLQGALELEVARQDAKLETQKQGSVNGLTGKNRSVKA
jgi:hypothetical protein